MKKGMSFNLKALWAFIGVLLAGVFAIVAFEGVGYRSSIGGTDFVSKLHNLANSGDSTTSDMYGLAVAGLVFTWLALIFPLVSFFTNQNKVNRYLSYADCSFLFLGFILMLASIALFADKFSGTINKGAVAGQFILIFVGAATSGVGTYFTYFNSKKITK